MSFLHPSPVNPVKAAGRFQRLPGSTTSCRRHTGSCRGLGEGGPQLWPFSLTGRISQRVEQSRSQLQTLGERVSLAQAKIEKIKGSKKAIKVGPVA